MTRILRVSTRNSILCHPDRTPVGPSGIAMELQWHCNGIWMESQWCSNGILMGPQTESQRNADEAPLGLGWVRLQFIVSLPPLEPHWAPR